MRTNWRVEKVATYPRQWKITRDIPPTYSPNAMSNFFENELDAQIEAIIRTEEDEKTLGNNP
jgi:hypothetical protein